MCLCGWAKQAAMVVCMVYRGHCTIRKAQNHMVGGLLKKLGGNNPLQIKKDSAYQQLINYWKPSGLKPAAEEAFDSAPCNWLKTVE